MKVFGGFDDTALTLACKERKPSNEIEKRLKVVEFLLIMGQTKQ